jgi:hypothetical protein
MTSYGGHGVPAEHKEASAATMRATANLLGEPTDAERSRTLLASKAFGSLATLSTECPGFPFGSLVGYAPDEHGRPLLCLSGLAEHSRNMAADPRASLLVTEHDGGPNLLALARVTLVGEMTTVDSDERQACLDRYLQAHPSAFYAAFHDFSVYRLQVADVRYVGGFGRMSWVSADGYAQAEPDPLIDAAERIIRHMNDDHADALADYCRTFGRVEPASAVLTGVDRYGMDVLATLAVGGERAVRITFTERADNTDAVRKQTVALLREARAQLGS